MEIELRKKLMKVMKMIEERQTQNERWLVLSLKEHLVVVESKYGFIKYGTYE